MFLPTSPATKVPEERRFMQEGAHRRLYRFSPNDYAEIGAIWGNGEQALGRSVRQRSPRVQGSWRFKCAGNDPDLLKRRD
jgi:hypothetical protein